jgi:hypothetical protein
VHSFFRPVPRFALPERSTLPGASNARRARSRHSGAVNVAKSCIYVILTRGYGCHLGVVESLGTPQVRQRFSSISPAVLVASSRNASMLISGANSLMGRAPVLGRGPRSVGRISPPVQGRNLGLMVLAERREQPRSHRHSRRQSQYDRAKRRRGRSADSSSFADSPLRDANRDRLIGLLTER